MSAEMEYIPGALSSAPLSTEADGLGGEEVVSGECGVAGAAGETGKFSAGVKLLSRFTITGP
jgi:hypothetical protein